MYYRDQHCHTEFSFDSKEKFENYLKLVKGDIITTEHLDYGFTYNDGRVEDVDIDYDKYVKVIEEHNQKSSQKILKGIEIGYTTENLDKIIKTVNGRDYDIQLLSVHQYDGKDFMNPKPEDNSQREFLTNYFEKMVEAVNNFKDFDVLTHIDYALRLNRLESKNMDIVDEFLTKVFAEIINDEKALELNTRSVYQYDNLEYYTFALKKYVKMKGKLFSVGSDAHYENYYRYHFDDAFKLLKSVDAKYLAMFENRKMTTIKMEDM